MERDGRITVQTALRIENTLKNSEGKGQSLA